MATDLEIFAYAVKLLARRDYSESALQKKLSAKFDVIPETVILKLRSKRYLDDRRFAENHVSRYNSRGPIRLKHELLARGISEQIADNALAAIKRPSLRAVVDAKMVDWQLDVPLRPSEAARLFRALLRLGYEEDAIREEIETLI